MDVQRYIDEMVEPTIADFEANPMSVRLTFLACLVTFHGKPSPETTWTFG